MIRDNRLYVADRGRPLFRNTPKPKGNQKRETVLIACTGIEERALREEMQTEKSRSPKKPLHECDEFAALHGIENCHYRFVTHLDMFWNEFFSAPKFFLDAADITLPVLIISTGRMRNYRSDSFSVEAVSRRRTIFDRLIPISDYANHAGERVEISERLSEIGNAFDVPVEFIPVKEPAGSPYPLVA